MVSSEWKTRFAIRDFAIRNHRTATFVRAIRPWRDRGAQDRVRRTDERTNGRKRKRKQNADRRGSTCCTVRRSAHPAGRARLSAFHGGSALGTHASQGAASDQVSRRWRLGGGGLPPAPTPVTASTSHAGHSAGGLDVQYRPSATGTNPLRAGTASRSRQPESPSDVLARRARGRPFYTFWDYCQ